MDRSFKRYLRRTSDDLITLAALLLKRADNIQKFISAHDQLRHGNERTEDANDDSSDEGCGSGEMMAAEHSTDSEDESVTSASNASDISSISSDSITGMSLSDDMSISETTSTDSEVSESDDSQNTTYIGLSDSLDF